MLLDNFDQHIKNNEMKSPFSLVGAALMISEDNFDQLNKNQSLTDFTLSVSSWYTAPL